MPSLADRFRDFARTAMPRAPLYAALSAEIAQDPAVWGLLEAAPAGQQMPVLLFATVHDLVLRGEAPELAAYYPSVAAAPLPPSEAFPAFRETCGRHADEIRATVATRSTQTNEVGRCAVFLPALGLLETEVGPLSLVDVGASAGLNLLLDRYAYRYEPGGTVGGPSPVTLACGTRGSVPLPSAPPQITGRLGLDAEPIDVCDPDQAGWLEACVWPDQLDRFQRLRAALAMARTDPPPVRRGDAVEDLAPAVTDAADSGHPTLLTSWVLNYLSPRQRVDFVARLDDLAHGHDISWVAAESPALTPELPFGAAADDPEDRTVLSLVRWRGGQREVGTLAVVHPHGFWMHWES